MALISEIVTFIPTNAPLFIVGDFSFDMSIENTATQRFIEQMQQYNMNFILNEEHVAKKTLIDHIWTNTPTNICSTYRTKAYLIDHLAIFTNIHYPPSPYSKLSLKIYSSKMNLYKNTLYVL